MKVSEFKKELKAIYQKYFNESALSIDNRSNRIYNAITIKPYLIKDQSEAINNITMNDMLRITFALTTTSGQFENDVYALHDEMILNDNLVLEAWDHCYTIKPDNQYMCYSSKSVTFRKTTGNAQHILKTLDKFFKRLNEQLKSDIQNDLIHKNHIDLLKLRLI